MTSPYEAPATPLPPERHDRGPTGLATRLDRVGAWIVDRSLAFGAIVFGAIASSILAVTAVKLGLVALLGPDRTASAAAAAAISVPAALVVYQTWLLATTGQTIGRRAHAIRVVAEDGGPARPSVVVAQALLRTGARHLVLIGLVGALTNAAPFLADTPGWPTRDRFAGLALLLAGGVPLLFDLADMRNGQALHDRLLHTRLVRERHHPPRPSPRLRIGLVVALVVAIAWFFSLR